MKPVSVSSMDSNMKRLSKKCICVSVYEEAKIKISFRDYTIFMHLYLFVLPGIFVLDDWEYSHTFFL